MRVGKSKIEIYPAVFQPHYAGPFVSTAPQRPLLGCGSPISFLSRQHDLAINEMSEACVTPDSRVRDGTSCRNVEWKS